MPSALAHASRGFRFGRLEDALSATKMESAKGKERRQADGGPWRPRWHHSFVPHNAESIVSAERSLLATKSARGGVGQVREARPCNTNAPSLALPSPAAGRAAVPIRSGQVAGRINKAIIAEVWAAAAWRRRSGAE